jgi:hypothetical protein
MAAWVLPAIQAGISLFGASQANKAGEEASELMMQGGALSKDASYANAADVESLGALNAGAITGAAQNNATMMREIGYANAQAIADATIHNIRMYNIQSQEELRLHERDERWHAGEIRAMQASTGVQVGSGSPLAYLNSEITKGIQERHYMETRDAWAMLGLADDGLKQSLLTVKSANYNAKVTQDNAALQAQVTIAESIAQAAAMRRQGDISAQVGVANAQAARSQGMAGALGAIGQSVGYAGNAYSSWKASQATTSYPVYGTGAANSFGVGTYNSSSGAGGF